VQILKYSAADGSSSSVGTINLGGAISGSQLVGGAVSPFNGIFYFGGWTTSGMFALYGWDTATDKPLGLMGYLKASDAQLTASANGDLAFDAKGNLYFVNSMSGDQVEVMVPAANVPSVAGTGTISGSQVATAKDNGAFNGVAYDASGTFYMSQSTFIAPGFGGQAINFTGGLKTVDLASCSLPTPPTAGNANVEVDPGAPATLTPPVTPGSSPITTGSFDNGQPTKTVPNEGTWNITVDPKTGQPTVTFTPEDGFTGTPTPQPYTVADKNGLTSDPGTLTVTVKPITGPTASDKSATTDPGKAVTLNPDTTFGTSQKFTSVTFDNGDTTKVVKGEGTWTIKLNDKNLPEAVFTPEAGFTGTTTPQKYTVTDENGKSASANLTVTVNKPITGPTAKDASATTNPKTPVTLDPETGFGTSQKFTSVAFPDGSTTKTVPGEGTWTIKLNDSGLPEATFTPEDDFTGKTTTPQPYVVTDENGLTATANLTVSVNAPAPVTPPTTGDASKAINPNETATLNPVTVPGSGDITKVTFDNGDTTKVVKGEGTWTIKLNDKNLPEAVFTPEDGFTGKTTEQPYTVTDGNGLTATAKLDVTVNKPLTPPTTGDASKTIDPNETATLTPKTVPGSGDITKVAFDNGQPTKDVPGEGTWSIKLDNGQPVATFTPDKDYSGKVTPQKYTVTDSNGKSADGTLNVTISPPAPVPPKTGDASKTIDPNETATLTPKTTPGSSPVKSVVFDNGQPTKDVPGEGTWSIKLDNGQPVATFTPDKDYSGKVTPQKYTVTDENGLKATGKLDVTVNTPPTTGDKSAVTNPETPVTLNPVTKPGSAPIKSVVFDNGKPSKTVPGEGTWTVELKDGQPVAVFTPAKGFTGKTTPQPYTVTDENGLKATGKLDVTVNTPPTTGDKSAVTNPGTPVTLAPTAKPGSAPIKSVVFDNGQPKKVVPGEGTWTVELKDGQPVAVFTPEDGFTGKTTPQPYTVTDGNGLTATGKLDVNINVPPATGDKSAVTNPETPVTLNPVTKPGSAPIKSVVFDNGKPSKTVPGEGTWTVELKDGQPVVVFTPVKGFTGKTAPQPYTVTDGNGLTATGKLDVTVNTPPTTGDAAKTINPNETATLTPKTTPGSSPVKSVVFDNGQPTKDVPGQGTWTVKLDNGQPVATFTPLKDYSGKVDPQPYTVTDGNGLTATGKLDVNINVPPATGDKSAVTNPGTPVTLNPVTKPGSAPIKSAVFDNGQPKKVVPGEGTWTVELKDGQPVVVFTPVKGFTGKASPQPYTVTDENGLTATGKLDVTVNTPPTTGDASKTIKPGETATLTPTAKPGSAPIKSAVFDNGKDTKDVPGEGTWTIVLKDGQPVATFTPVKGFTGPVTPQKYTVTDENGLTADGTLTVSISKPAPAPSTPAKPAPSTPAKPAPAAPAAPAKQPQSILATTGASVGIALLAMVVLAAAGLGLRKLSRRNGSD
jgi:CshA-type fibril repeat protein